MTDALAGRHRRDRGIRPRRAALWPDPDRFDVRRKPSDHLAFGRGEHVCVGMHLARIEIAALFEALISRVERFDVLESDLALNNTLRGFGTLKVRVS